MNTDHYFTDSNEYHTADEEVSNVVKGGLLSESTRDMAHLMEPKDCGERHQVSPWLRKEGVRTLGDAGTRALPGLLANGKVLCFKTPLRLVTPGPVRSYGSAALSSVECGVVLAGECAVSRRKLVGPTSWPSATVLMGEETQSSVKSTSKEINPYTKILTSTITDSSIPYLLKFPNINFCKDYLHMRKDNLVNFLLSNYHISSQTSKDSIPQMQSLNTLAIGILKINNVV